MMGHQPPPQPSLFYTGINLEKRIRADHVLRKVAAMVDFDFVYQEVSLRGRCDFCGFMLDILSCLVVPAWMLQVIAWSDPASG